MVAENNNVEGVVIPSVFQTSLVITEKNGLPCLEIRKVTTDPATIRDLISSAFHQRPVIMQPVFRDRIKAVGSLQEKGIIQFDSETEQYVYLI